MCGESFHLIDRGVASAIKKYGRNFLSDGMVGILRDHDIVLANIESVLSNVGRNERRLRSLPLRGRPEAAGFLAHWGVNVAHIANNHFFEHGMEAASDTIDNLEREGIRVIDCGNQTEQETRPGILELKVHGHSVAIIAGCFHPGRYSIKTAWRDLLAMIEAESRQDKTVIVSLHWGDEFIDRPNVWQRHAKDEMIAHGATAVIGHHPHVVQGIDDRNGTLTAYSLGNFIFDGVTKLTNWAFILSFEVCGHKVVSWEAIPFIRDEHYRPVLVSGEKEAHLRAEITLRSRACQLEIVDENEYTSKYELELKRLSREIRRGLWHYVGRRFFSYRIHLWPQVLFRPIRRRLGFW